jgi:hypothetical protein
MSWVKQRRGQIIARTLCNQDIVESNGGPLGALLHHVLSWGAGGLRNIAWSIFIGGEEWL